MFPLSKVQYRVGESEDNSSGKHNSVGPLLYQEKSIISKVSKAAQKTTQLSLKSELCLIDVYLPYCSRANTDEFLAYLGKLRQLCEELQCPNICFVGTSTLEPQIHLVVCWKTFVWKMILSFLIMHYYPRTYSHTLVMHTTQLLG